MKIRSFNNKSKVFDYIRRNFKKSNKLIIVRGSTAIKPIKNFSDIDVEIYGNKIKNEHYELVFVKNKLVLISIHYYLYKNGESIQIPKNVKILYGKYNKNTKPDFSMKKRNNKEMVKRQCQLAIDFFFKYLRSHDKKYLLNVQKRM